MTSDSEEAPFARAPLITLTVLALYVLSEGPVYGAMARGYQAPDWVMTAYFPIVWTARHCEPVDKALRWYLELWMSR